MNLLFLPDTHLRRRCRGLLSGLVLLLPVACGDGATEPPAPPVEIAVDSAQVTLLPGEVRQLTVAVRNAANAAVTYTSSDTLIASVSATGLVLARAPGGATVTVRSVQDTARTERVLVRVNPPPVGIEIIGTGATSVEVGATTRLTTTLRNTNNIGVTWSTSDPGVGGDGTVTGVAVGTATITATAHADTTRKASIQLRVVPPIRVVVTPNYVSLVPGRTQQLTATVTGTLDTAVVWRVDRPDIATINASGLVTGVAPGSTSVIALLRADTTKRGSTVASVFPSREVKLSLATSTLGLGVGAALLVATPKSAASTLQRPTGSPGQDWS